MCIRDSSSSSSSSSSCCSKKDEQQLSILHSNSDSVTMERGEVGGEESENVPIITSMTSDAQLPSTLVDAKSFLNHTFVSPDKQLADNITDVSISSIETYSNAERKDNINSVEQLRNGFVEIVNNRKRNREDDMEGMYDNGNENDSGDELRSIKKKKKEKMKRILTT